MNRNNYPVIRVGIILFIILIVYLAIVNNSLLLAVTGSVSGLVFLTLVRSKVKIVEDEREKTIKEKAAGTTYAVFAPTLAIGTFLLLFPAYSNLPVFAKGEFTYLESLGVIFAYLTLFLIVLYALSYRYYSRKYGGGNNEE